MSTSTDATAQAEGAEPRVELARGLAREREREHVTRIDVVGDDAVRDATREHAGLARPGAGQDAQGRARRDDGLVLLGVEAVDEVGHPCEVGAGGGS